MEVLRGPESTKHPLSLHLNPTAMAKSNNPSASLAVVNSRRSTLRASTISATSNSSKAHSRTGGAHTAGKSVSPKKKAPHSPKSPKSKKSFSRAVCGRSVRSSRRMPYGLRPVVF
eukprot:m.475109 g.475109  ORF g.475109 m.475109 type:complete len:115 (-) comp37686_c0_seq1:246-590(-)